MTTGRHHISSEKIRRELGFVPRETIEDAVRGLVDGFQAGKIPDPMTDIRYSQHQDDASPAAQVDVCGARRRRRGILRAPLAIHVIVWRIRRPESCLAWLPTLVVIFGPVRGRYSMAAGADVARCGRGLLLHGTLSAVYVIGYTLGLGVQPLGGTH